MKALRRISKTLKKRSILKQISRYQDMLYINQHSKFMRGVLKIKLRELKTELKELEN